MAIVQCPNNHYYDDKRSQTCPYCDKLHTAPAVPDSIREQLTSYVIPDLEEDDSAQLTQGYGEDVCEYERTIGIFLDESHNQLTTGWLVCVEGPMKGKSYTLFSGRNFIGSSLDMDVVLADDPEIAPSRHFVIAYDPRAIGFYLVAGEGHTYLNGEAVRDQLLLTENDRIQAGQCTFVFVPFCREGRAWN